MGVHDRPEYAPPKSIHHGETNSTRNSAHRIKQNQYYLTPEGYITSIPKCENCDHAPRKNCTCSNCEEQKSKNIDSIVEKIRNKAAETEPTPPPKKLSSKQILVTLYALTYGRKSDEDTICLDVLGEQDKKIAMSTALFTPNPSSTYKTVVMGSTYEYYIDHRKTDYKVVRPPLSSCDELKFELKELAFKKALNQENLFELLELWGDVALHEAMKVLLHYCNGLNLEYRPGENTVSAIKKSLSKFGLSLTAQFICKSAERAKTRGLMLNYDRRRSFNLIYENLNFWIEDERPRSWNIQPHLRTDDIFSESRSATVFSHSFLSIHGADYLSDPICYTSLSNLGSST